MARIVVWPQRHGMTGIKRVTGAAPAGPAPRALNEARRGTVPVRTHPSSRARVTVRS